MIRLSNKQTGESGELHYNEGKEYRFTVVAEDPTQTRIYKTLGEVLKDWTDFIIHESDEPLIKDEKVRKAVQAWAEANDLSETKYIELPNGCGFAFEYTDTDNVVICLRSVWLELEKGKSYAITELCGEEEE